MNREEDIVSLAVQYVKAKEAARAYFALPVGEFLEKLREHTALKEAEEDAYDALRMAVEDAGYGDEAGA